MRSRRATVESVWRFDTGGGDLTKSGRLSVGAAKKRVRCQGAEWGGAREAMPLESLCPGGAQKRIDRLRMKGSPTSRGQTRNRESFESVFSFELDDCWREVGISIAMKSRPGTARRRRQARREPC
jgi:hypothetical protein